MNNQSKQVKVTFNTVATSLRPKQYGKAETTGTNKKASLTLQLHKASSIVRRVFAHLSPSGKISFHEQTLTILNNSQTNNEGMKRRPVFVTSSLDPRMYETKKGRINYDDSNPHLMSLYNDLKSGYNSIIVNASLDSQYIPYAISNKENPELNWDNKEHNKHALILSVKLDQIDKSNLSNSDKAKRTQEAWEEYQASEKALVDQGVLVYNMVLVAQPSGIVPALTATQDSKANNQYFSGKDLFSNENSKATYCPIVNKVSFIGEFTGSMNDDLSNWEYGLRTFNTGSNDSDDESTNGVKSYSAEVKAFNMFNRRLDVASRIVITDPFFANANRAENFGEFSSTNSMVRVSNARLELGFTALGGLTSVFSFTGDDLYYTGYSDTKVNNIVDITSDIDDNIELNSNDMDIIEVSDIFNPETTDDSVSIDENTITSDEF